MALDERNILSDHSVFGQVLRPGMKILGRSSNLTMTKWGFRGRDFPLEKGKWTFRVVVLGDQVVFERFAEKLRYDFDRRA